MTKEETLTQYLVENQERFYRLAYSMLKNPDEALVAVQTAVCRALERQNGLRDAGAVRAWGREPRAWRNRLTAKHIFTHVEWRMTCYTLEVSGQAGFVWVDDFEQHAVPSAFARCREEAERALRE